MTQDTATVNADDQIEESAEIKAPTLDDFKPKPNPKEAKKPAKDEVEDDEGEEQEDETEEEEVEQTESDDESEEGEVLSQEIDIDEIPEEERVGYLDSLYDSLTDEDRRKWLSNREGRVGKDMGKMRQRAAEAEEKAAAAEAKYQELANKSINSDNPFATITDPAELDTRVQEIDSNIKAIRQFLRGNEDYITVGNEEVDRATVDGWLDVYLAQKDAIPKQRDRIRAISKAKEGMESAEAKLKETYSWMADTDSEQSKAYRKLKADPKWAMVTDFIPELAEELPKVLAKYVDGGTEAKPVAKKKLPARGIRKPKGDLGAGGGRKKRDPRSEAKERLFQGSASTADRLALFS